jgi:DNA end-binding protein Ku
VIRDAMKDKDRMALARIVIANREHVIALEPLGKGLVGTTLRYDYEVRDEKDYFSDVPAVRVTRDMVNLAAHILETKAARFDPAKFKDRYEDALKKLIRRKAKGKTIEAPEAPAEESNVIDLMEALRQSVKKPKGTVKATAKDKPKARKAKSRAQRAA